MRIPRNSQELTDHFIILRVQRASTISSTQSLTTVFVGDNLAYMNLEPFELDPPLLPDMFRFLLRMPKAQSSFVYFIFEANEGLCFYSTLAHERGDLTRDMVLRGDRTMYNETKRLINFLKESVQGLEILEENQS